ncbi:hypothetical protein C8R45DRAFT_930305 [Mycena sanguinolenta]|nr:hypothetical protein C8R45DRAFT_930305 [Mycena sanguinolenta]
MLIPSRLSFSTMVCTGRWALLTSCAVAPHLTLQGWPPAYPSLQLGVLLLCFFISCEPIAGGLSGLETQSEGRAGAVSVLLAGWMGFRQCGVRRRVLTGNESMSAWRKERFKKRTHLRSLLLAQISLLRVDWARRPFIRSTKTLSKSEEAGPEDSIEVQNTGHRTQSGCAQPLIGNQTFADNSRFQLASQIPLRELARRVHADDDSESVGRRERGPRSRSRSRQGEGEYVESKLSHVDTRDATAIVIG